MRRTHLTKQLIQRISCPENMKKIRYYDQKQKGLFLQIRSSGTKTYYVRYRDKRGRNVELKIADAADINPPQARREAAMIREQVALGKDPLKKKSESRAVLSFDEFAKKKYLPFIQNYKKSWGLDERLLRIYLLPRIGKKYIDEITKQDIVEIHQEEYRNGAAPASANRLVILLRYMFNLGIQWDTPGITSNPAKGVPLLKENNRRERYLNIEETKRLYEALLKSPNPMLKPIISMLILTGARKSEVLYAKWEEIDFEMRLWRVSMTKSGKARHVPLSDGALKILAETPNIPGSPYIFAKPKTGKPFASIFRSWDTARKQAGLPEVRIHDLRHSFASFLINSGRSLYEVQKLLGHSQIQTTQRYAHLSQDTLLEATNIVSNSLDYGDEVQKLPSSNSSSQ